MAKNGYLGRYLGDIYPFGKRNENLHSAFTNQSDFHRALTEGLEGPGDAFEFMMPRGIPRGQSGLSLNDMLNPAMPQFMEDYDFMGIGEGKATGWLPGPLGALFKI